jgi:hypothetical protein
MLVEAFGYRAETTQPSHDYGVDVVAENERRRVVIQCKLYGRGRVGGDTIMQLIGTREHSEATDAICITTSYFTRQAQEIAATRNIHLIDRVMLLGICRENSLTIPSLTVLAHGDGEHFKIRERETSIGRTADNDLRVDHLQVSRHHAVLERTGLHLSVRDVGSTNGTFVDGLRIAVPTRLNYGSVVVIGGLRLEVAFRGPGNSK